MRTHTCGSLRKTDVGKTVTLCGWIQKRRDHGGLIFIDLRDRYGLTQIIFDPIIDTASYQKAIHLTQESSISISGNVRLRKPGMANGKLATGEIEVEASSIEIFSKSAPPPFEINKETFDIQEDRLLTYRYLDIRRRKQLIRNLSLRHNITAVVRDFCNRHKFIEIETPLLTKPTPEGARDYIVPSRHTKRLFFCPSPVPTVI